MSSAFDHKGFSDLFPDEYAIFSSISSAKRNKLKQYISLFTSSTEVPIGSTSVFWIAIEIEKRKLSEQELASVWRWLTLFDERVRDKQRFKQTLHANDFLDAIQKMRPSTRNEYTDEELDEILKILRLPRDAAYQAGVKKDKPFFKIKREYIETASSAKH